MDKQIASYAATRELIAANNLRAKKNFGQNFLVDPFVLEKIVSAPNVTKDDLVIEIGPGLGALTQALLERAGHVVAVELDSQLAQLLQTTLSGYENLTILNADALTCDWTEITRTHGYSSFKVVANLPYYITTPLIMSFLEGSAPVASVTIMIQREVAARILAKPSTRDYGALTLGVAFRATGKLVANVPRNCFIPRPNVDSAVICLEVLQTPPVDVTNEKLLFDIIKAAFGQRRKTLVNCISTLELPGFTKEIIENTLIQCGLDKNIRGEALSLAEFAVIANAITAITKDT
ncbi:MAG: 16S rRNA (adenine(1518)-N(6)/adenine(1519)-N(6))-dimethyltransferase RsmA [Defluviitaleaceae bacterium]|nr:16S rRNA (adenine(1518)-N(6)/adenine(1519)-N(6))-dimethyltransferase RsmA [Defluviitaleaceae bacterium]